MSRRTSTPRIVAAALATALLAVGAQAAAQPPEPSLRVEVAEGEHTVGDRVPVELVLLAPLGAAVPPRFPAWGETWGAAEIVEVGEPAMEEPPPDAPSGSVQWTQRLVLTAFRPGRVELPPREVAVPAGGEALSTRVTTPDDLALEIASVLPGSEAEGTGGTRGTDGTESGAGEIPPPKPEKPLRELPVGAPFLWTAAALATLLAALLVLLWRRRRRTAHRTAGDARPDLAPLDELHHGLARARGAGEPAEGLARVSLALRRYLGRRLGFHAVESTTTEIRRRLGGRRLPAGAARRCDELLTACDLVKFARRPATEGDLERWTVTAEEVAGRIEDHLRPADEEAPATERREEAA